MKLSRCGVEGISKTSMWRNSVKGWFVWTKSRPRYRDYGSQAFSKLRQSSDINMSCKLIIRTPQSDADGSPASTAAPQWCSRIGLLCTPGFILVQGLCKLMTHSRLGVDVCGAALCRDIAGRYKSGPSTCAAADRASLRLPASVTTDPLS